MNPWSVCNIHVYCVMHVHSSSDKLILYSCILSETVTDQYGGICMALHTVLQCDMYIHLLPDFNR